MRNKYREYSLSPHHRTDDHGQQVQLSRRNGTPVIIAIACTACTRICNATLHRLEEAQQLADQINARVDFCGQL